MIGLNYILGSRMGPIYEVFVNIGRNIMQNAVGDSHIKSLIMWCRIKFMDVLVAGQKKFMY